MSIISQMMSTYHTWTHLKDVAEKTDSHPLFLTQDQSRNLAPLVGICFLESQPEDELIN